MINYIVTSNRNIAFNIVSNTETFAGVIPANHPNYNKILEEVRKKNDKPSRQIARLKKLIDALGEVKAKIKNINVYNNNVTYKGVVVHNIVVDKILEFAREDYDVKPLMLFLDKLMENPNPEAITSLYNWLERAGMIIDQDGDILGYKSVRQDYLDHHSASISNKVGENPTMPRENVSSDPGYCSGPGLYVGTLHYAQNFHSEANKIMVVKVHPKDVVIVPNREHDKMKTCGYKVIGELENYALLKQGDYVSGCSGTI